MRKSTSRYTWRMVRLGGRMLKVKREECLTSQHFRIYRFISLIAGFREGCSDAE